MVSTPSLVHLLVVRSDFGKMIVRRLHLLRGGFQLPVVPDA